MANKIQDFMPHYKDIEEEFKAAKIKDLKTNKISSWPYRKDTDQLLYENWLSEVINEETGEWNPERRGPEGTPVKGSGARYVVNVIVRFKVGKEEFVCSKGRLEGFSSAGQLKTRWIMYPERWLSSTFGYNKTINEKKMTFDTVCTGPNGSEMKYDLPFNPENVKKLFDKSDGENIQFYLKDDKTGEAMEIKWSSVKDTLKLFSEKSWDYLIHGDYIPEPVKLELRAKAEQQGLIPQSHTQMPSRPPTTGTYS
jgi:hypothetical protein